MFDKHLKNAGGLVNIKYVDENFWGKRKKTNKMQTKDF